MSFAIVTDSGANLPTALIAKYDLHVVAMSCWVNGTAYLCDDLDRFDGDAFYATLRDKNTAVSTSLVNADAFLRVMEPLAQAGQDILYIGLSSGVSGTYQAAFTAVAQLRELYPGQNFSALDSLGAGLGEGMLAIEAAKLRDAGLSLDAAERKLIKLRTHRHQLFTVDDLMYLRRGGRLSGLSAMVGTVLNIKPLLTGREGRIVVYGKTKGRRSALKALAEDYRNKVIQADRQTVYITHGGCPQDAALLAEMVMAACPPADIITVPHEPVTGCHVGPGMLALFFFGQETQ